MRRAVASAMLMTWVTGCATVGASQANVCPESRGLRCATPPTCSLDRVRGCRVCACEAWDPARSATPEKGGRPYQPERDPATAPGEISPPAR